MVWCCLPQKESTGDGKPEHWASPHSTAHCLCTLQCSAWSFCASTVSVLLGVVTPTYNTLKIVLHIKCLPCKYSHGGKHIVVACYDLLSVLEGLEVTAHQEGSHLVKDNALSVERLLPTAPGRCFLSNQICWKPTGQASHSENLPGSKSKSHKSGDKAGG